MHIKTTLFYLLTLCVLSRSYAQPRCGFETRMDQMRKENPGIDQLVNRQVQEYISTQNKLTNTEATVYYIPVVVHVIHTGGAVGTIYNPADANINAAISYLNAVYDGTWNGAGGSILGAGDIQLKFVLATKDPENNPTSGIVRVNGSIISNYNSSGVMLSSTGADEVTVKDLSRWDPLRYYNIWVVNRIDGLDGTSGSFFGGYATFPLANNSTNNSLRRDGTVMLATQMIAGAKTLPHEIGHAFSLYHPFQGETNITGGLNTCPSNGNPVTDGDLCADTDPIINPADDGYGSSAFSCRSGTNSCSGTAFNNNTEWNFMNYTTCYRLFTNDQKTRMLATAANTTRNGLASSWANGQGSYPTSWLPPVPATVTPVSAGNYPNAIGIMNVSMNGMTIYSLNATQDNGYVNNVKWYNLFEVSPNTSYSMNIGLNNSGFYEQIGVWIDYDGNGSFNDGNERVYYNSSNAPAGSVLINFTTPSTLSGSIVRIRIMNDYSTAYGMAALSGASSSVFAGQAEDYPVFLRSTSPLPLTLVKFTGQSAGHTNLLEWRTSQETNTKEFQVERSVNGNGFDHIGTVKASVNTTTETVYRFNDDKGIVGGTYVYRLKMVDIDDHYTYSHSISLKIKDPADVEIVGNPFSNSIKIKTARNAIASLRLMDITGRTIVQRNVTQTSGGIIEMNVDPSLTRGVYLLETVVNNQKTVYKLVKE